MPCGLQRFGSGLRQKERPLWKALRHCPHRNCMKTIRTHLDRCRCPMVIWIRRKFRRVPCGGVRLLRRKLPRTRTTQLPLDQAQKNGCPSTQILTVWNSRTGYTKTQSLIIILPVKILRRQHYGSLLLPTCPSAGEAVSTAAEQWTWRWGTSSLTFILGDLWQCRQCV